MKNSISIIVLFLFISIKIHAQFIDSVFTTYDINTEKLNIFVKGQFHSGDPGGIYSSSYTYSNDSLIFRIDFSVCGTWPMALNFDTTFVLSIKLNPGILYGSVYSYNVQNLDTNDCRYDPNPTAKVDSAFFTLNVPLSIQEHSNSLAIYPNPTQDFIYISAQYLQKSYTVYDILGRKCMEGILNEERLNLAALKPGQYVLVLEGAKPVRLIRE